MSIEEGDSLFDCLWPRCLGCKDPPDRFFPVAKYFREFVVNKGEEDLAEGPKRKPVSNHVDHFCAAHVFEKKMIGEKWKDAGNRMRYDHGRSKGVGHGAEYKAEISFMRRRFTPKS